MIFLRICNFFQSLKIRRSSSSSSRIFSDPLGHSNIELSIWYPSYVPDCTSHRSIQYALVQGSLAVTVARKRAEVKERERERETDKEKKGRERKRVAVARVRARRSPSAAQKAFLQLRIRVQGIQFHVGFHCMRVGVHRFAGAGRYSLYARLRTCGRVARKRDRERDSNRPTIKRDCLS